MLTFFTHSTSEDNELGIRSGWNNPTLSARGLAQAAELRKTADSSEFECVYSSDLLRATQTAEIAFPGIERVADPRLREMNYGALNGHPAAAFPTDEKECIENRFPSGESCLDVQSRVQEFLNEHYQADRRIAVVGHRFTQLALEVIFHARDWASALELDWRHDGNWQPGWCYQIACRTEDV